MINILGAFLQTCRLRQWHKNLFVFAPLVFAKLLGDRIALACACGAFFAFCSLSSAVYVLNDLHDAEIDRHHPQKRRRPIASGQLPVSLAWVGCSILICFGLAVTIILARLVGGHSGAGLAFATLLYLLLNVAYNLGLKGVVILDVLVVSAGFVLRVMAGAFAIQVDFSQWLLLCTFFVALFLALAKRRHELVNLEDAANHRPILREYSALLLEQLMLVVTAATLVSYTLYTRDPETIARTGSNHLIYTVPFVTYGLFRYLYLVHQHDEGGDPAELVLRDPGMMICVAGWVVIVWVLLYFHLGLRLSA